MCLLYDNAGVRYFMIKSWNHDNVLTAMSDGLWATQEKNEQLLTEAYKHSRHVILLFSVNKSTAFQGYVSLSYSFDQRPVKHCPALVKSLAVSRSSC